MLKHVFMTSLLATAAIIASRPVNPSQARSQLEQMVGEASYAALPARLAEINRDISAKDCVISLVLPASC